MNETKMLWQREKGVVMLTDHEDIRTYIDSKMEEINEVIKEYGKEGEEIPQDLLAVIIVYDDIQLLKDYLISGYAQVPYISCFGWIRPSTDVIKFDDPISFITDKHATFKQSDGGSF